MARPHDGKRRPPDARFHLDPPQRTTHYPNTLPEEPIQWTWPVAGAGPIVFLRWNTRRQHASGEDALDHCTHMTTE